MKWGDMQHVPSAIREAVKEGLIGAHYTDFEQASRADQLQQAANAIDPAQRVAYLQSLLASMPEQTWGVLPPAVPTYTVDLAAL